MITFNLDQYYSTNKDALQNYHYFMLKNLFEQTDIDRNNYHLPDGMIEKNDVKTNWLVYEKQIEAAGGIGLQIPDISIIRKNGLNETASVIYIKKRLINLNNSNRMKFGN